MKDKLVVSNRITEKDIRLLLFETDNVTIISKSLFAKIAKELIEQSSKR